MNKLLKCLAWVRTIITQDVRYGSCDTSVLVDYKKFEEAVCYHQKTTGINIQSFITQVEKEKPFVDPRICDRAIEILNAFR